MVSGPALKPPLFHHFRTVGNFVAQKGPHAAFRVAAFPSWCPVHQKPATRLDGLVCFRKPCWHRLLSSTHVLSQTTNWLHPGMGKMFWAPVYNTSFPLYTPLSLLNLDTRLTLWPTVYWCRKSQSKPSILCFWTGDWLEVKWLACRRTCTNQGILLQCTEEHHILTRGIYPGMQKKRYKTQESLFFPPQKVIQLHKLPTVADKHYFCIQIPKYSSPQPTKILNYTKILINIAVTCRPGFNLYLDPGKVQMHTI